jgi:HNH endonuclease/NUMOD4 motif
MAHEEWRPVAGYEDRYEVSSWGRVRSWAPWGGRIPNEPRYIALRLHRDGYIKVGLSRAGKVTWFQVHRLVAVAWHGAPECDDLEVRHKDGSRTNNQAENLCWGTAKENAADRRLHGKDTVGVNNGMAKLSPEDAREILQSTDSCSVLAAKFGVTRGNIWNIRNGKSWGHVRGVA